LANPNTLYLARCGGGKSQALHQNPDFPKAKARVILWDKSHDHFARHYEKKPQFVAALRAGLASGKGFRIAYAGGVSPADYEWFCSVVWACLDGRVNTWVIVEELSEVSTTSAKASPAAAKLLNQGRKYGMIFHGTSQKPQEIAKTYYDQSEIMHVGQQKGANVQKFARELNISEENIRNLKPLQFFKVDEKEDAPQLYSLNYHKIQPIGSEQKKD